MLTENFASNPQTTELNVNFKKMNIDELAKRWIEAQEGPAELRELDEANWPPISKVIDLSLYPAYSINDVELLWEFIKKVYELEPKEDTLQQLGAGPLEDLITYWGGKFIDSIEDFVNENPGFKIVMSNVWFSSEEAATYSDVTVHKRFFDLAGVEPNFK